jgi:hypothetical protein
VIVAVRRARNSSGPDQMLGVTGFSPAAQRCIVRLLISRLRAKIDCQ